ncbi:hypothetical protein BASA50_009436 [Batrachochytrium salamandrivorans]|uniref:Tr-type G domain-containing protein n=1 Tax=Batrachochytrium salamandrivorans TaxID=1357716 RepID=A0ABQ8F1N6_9FUNG|nr:hypothetical protein BASA50_009436 [Batrachochytrium salamandrivorans]KAH6594096.1 hypothetical protein BASA61_004085 [Batrachochytrium salamandrivorans]KAH9247603.1 hypothetical protein BASA81_014781 [Batrachochytrium salamandrivorans]KAH9273254.1 hypothetical protein BASA83_004543 [Batrachochytrium salamandrivorans]
MSRHRNMHRMDLDDYYDNDGEDYDEDDYDATAEEGYADDDVAFHVPYDPSEHKATVNAGLQKEIALVSQVVGRCHSDNHIRKVLVAHGNNVERTIDYILSDQEKGNVNLSGGPVGCTIEKAHLHPAATCQSLELRRKAMAEVAAPILESAPVVSMQGNSLKIFKQKSHSSKDVPETDTNDDLVLKCTYSIQEIPEDSLVFLQDGGDVVDSVEMAVFKPPAITNFFYHRGSPLKYKIHRDPPFQYLSSNSSRNISGSDLDNGSKKHAFVDVDIVSKTASTDSVASITLPVAASLIDRRGQISSHAPTSSLALGSLHRPTPISHVRVSGDSKVGSFSSSKLPSKYATHTMKNTPSSEGNRNESPLLSIKSISSANTPALTTQPLSTSKNSLSSILSRTQSSRPQISDISTVQSNSSLMSLSSLAELQKRPSLNGGRQSVIKSALSALTSSQSSSSSIVSSQNISGSSARAPLQPKPHQITLSQLSAGPLSAFTQPSLLSSLGNNKFSSGSASKSATGSYVSTNTLISARNSSTKTLRNLSFTQESIDIEPITAATSGPFAPPTINGAPSCFAGFIIKRALYIHQSGLTNRHSLLSVDVRSSSSVAGLSAFEFNQPSPDDTVKMARTKKTVGGKTCRTPASLSANSVDIVVSDMEALGFKSVKPSSRSHVDLKKKNQNMSSLVNTDISPQIDSLSKMSRTHSSESTSGIAKSQPGSLIKGSPKFKRINIKEELQKRLTEKQHMNLVVVGHVDAGKSTMMGHLLVILGEVSERTIKKYEREAEKIRKGSFAFAWVLDETEDERSRGVTIDVAVSKFETPKYLFTLLDAPGHKDFIPNMISGASQADVAVLVVDSIQGEFESGFDNGGQTREHAILLRSLGVRQLIVAVNKLDAMDWSLSRFEDVVAQLIPFLTQVGFKQQQVTFVPCSGFTGENLQKRQADALCKWYSGPTLVEALDSFTIPVRAVDRSFRLSIQDLFKGAMGAGSGGDVTVSGRIEAGSIQLGETVVAMPIGESGQVRAIEVDGTGVAWASAGDHVSISFSGLDIQQLSMGDILCEPAAPVPVTNHFRAQIVTLDITTPLTIGVPIVIHHLGRSEAGFLTRLDSILDKATGQVIKKHPRVLTKNMTAVVEIRTQRLICLEPFQTTKELGRFMLRSSSVTVAAGVVLDILSFEKASKMLSTE